MSDEETEGLFLVDFTQKIIDKKRATLAQRDAEREEDDDGDSSTPIPAPQNPDEEWYCLINLALEICSLFLCCLKVCVNLISKKLTLIKNVKMYS